MSRMVTKLKCPKCGSEKFLAGPRGGAARNIKCAKCGYWMNVTPILRLIPGTDAAVGGGFWIAEEQGFDEAKRLEAGNGTK